MGLALRGQRQENRGLGQDGVYGILKASLCCCVGLASKNETNKTKNKITNIGLGRGLHSSGAESQPHMYNVLFFKKSEDKF